ncbi:hypothetical protein Hanom_Chr17g01577821 [Helianthus anomalus]
MHSNYIIHISIPYNKTKQVEATWHLLKPLIATWHSKTIPSKRLSANSPLSRFPFIFSHTLLFAIICNPNYLCLPHSLFSMFRAFHLLPLIVHVVPHQHLSLQ